VLFILSVPICLVMQIYFWIAWRGLWRIVGSQPIVALVAGCIHGYVQHSNLWPFWITEFAPYGVAGGLVLWIIWLLVPKEWSRCCMKSLSAAFEQRAADQAGLPPSGSERRQRDTAALQ
jgi:hypothetical protein